MKYAKFDHVPDLESHIRAAQGGCPKAFGVLIEMVEPLIGSMIRRWSIEKEDVRQIAALSMVEVLRRYDCNIGGEKAFLSYYKRALVNSLALELSRTRSVKVSNDMARDVWVGYIEDVGPSVEKQIDERDFVEDIINQQTYKKIRTVLDDMNERDSTIVKRRIFDGEMLEPIARDYDVTPSRIVQICNDFVARCRRRFVFDEATGKSLN